MSHTHERIPALSAKLSGHSDFADGRDAAKTMLENYEVMELVEGTNLRPEDEDTDASDSLKAAIKKEQVQRDQKNRWAKAFLV